MASDIIRPARPEDAESLCRLNREFNGDDTADAAHIRRQLAIPGPEICLVSERDGKLTGFVCGTLFHSLCYKDPVGQVTELYVAPDARRNGVGSALICGMVDQMQLYGASEISLLTGDDNLPAQRLYEKCGFARESECIYQIELE